MFGDIPVEISPMYEGERIRAANMFVELGGPKSIGAELVLVSESVEDGKITVVGPEIKDMEEGKIYPLGILLEVSGKQLEKDLEGVIERRIHEICNYVQGFMHLNQRDKIWCRVSKDSHKKGFGLNHLGKAISIMFKDEFPIIEEIAVTIMTEEEKVKEFVEKAKLEYEKRDSKARDLSEEDVDSFYGCVMCQSFAPTHVCVITPDRPALCGGINWFDCRAAAKIDPEGPIFEIPKGELLDSVTGEYTSLNNTVAENSQHTFNKVYLHSIFGHPHTSCGCFEAVAFYMPELDGIGVVHRDFKGDTPLGIPFSAMAGQCSGGKQVEGFSGLCVEYMRSPKFLKADGGYERIVWLPKEIKEKILENIPKELHEKIATEEDVSSIHHLKKFLSEKNHPVIKRISELESTEKEPETVFEEEKESNSEMVQFAQVPEMAIPTSGGIKIILKNAKIYAEKVIITKK
ncbi:CO dehydrogenase/acetyl-CoA synthase complex, beta subunit [Methanococcus vannielii SB]|jgi:acetyl-CoA decarbonylase/synthase complex subunit beta|uniref:Acetyl-CoA decarbonylase/synthase complex subunit beta n=1 Tax=Methanococcus vannielii (strain ATCC 35089 / DSM 1224 / JCM 13029 / OCM 148 / SB) TaxID=406327 RepID=A6UNZ6_METVS|nr:CO dehydrogenase/CO-methylating acetyl-CoA synthase complex subunit beta [Methanococcus vannielii]ABR54218.1 CO dehydrogenase/acetyl-CoA synthase complex, beta subunit [Methanococcus vannielii SB]